MACTTRGESREATHNSKGFLTSHRQHEKLPQVPMATRRTHTSCRNWNNTLRFSFPCKLRPDSPALTPEHSCTHPRNSNGDLTSLRQHDRLPDLPIVPAEEPQASRRNSRQTTIFPHQREMRPFSPATPRMQSLVPFQNSRGGLSPFLQLKGAQRSPSKLEMKAEFPATTREVHRETPLPRELRPDFPDVTPEHSHSGPRNATRMET